MSQGDFKRERERSTFPANRQTNAHISPLSHHAQASRCTHPGSEYRPLEQCADWSLDCVANLTMWGRVLNNEQPLASLSLIPTRVRDWWLRRSSGVMIMTMWQSELNVKKEGLIFVCFQYTPTALQCIMCDPRPGHTITEAQWTDKVEN